jgi:hypothetical protein
LRQECARHPNRREEAEALVVGEVRYVGETLSVRPWTADDQDRGGMPRLNGPLAARNHSEICRPER